MMAKSRLAFLLVTVSILVLQPSPMSGAPLLTNGGFEGGTARDTLYWTPSGGPYSTQFREIDGPEGWTAWWREGFPCAGTPDWRTGRPEVRMITAVPDAERVRSGAQAVHWFTFWRCHEGGLLQRVAVEEGRYYTFSAFGHSWFSNCSLRPHDPPYGYDCETPIAWAQNWLSVGIDPTGEIDPTGPAVVWGAAREVYGVYDGPLTVGHVQAQAMTMTVFLRSAASHPLKHVDFYIDDVTLIGYAYRILLPMIIREA